MPPVPMLANARSAALRAEPGGLPTPVDGANAPDLSLLRKATLLYIALWIFEGALRKWIFPGLANPLLIVRDPVLLGLYVLAYAKGVFPRSAFIPWIAGLGLLATFVSLAATNAPLTVTLYGLRSDYLHLPLVFLLPNVLRRTELRLIGTGWLAVTAGMGVLVLLQFGAGPGAFLNRGAGEGTAMLDSAFGRIRPSGTFSYTNGLTEFTIVAAAFFLQHLLEKRLVPRLIWLAAIPALLTLVMLSGSRAAAASMGLIVSSVLLVCVVQKRYRSASLKLVGVLWLAGLLVGSFAVFKRGTEVFTERFKSNKVEQNGFVGRYLHSYAQPFEVMDRAEAGGVGLGMGTNVAAGLIKGERKFMFAEGEGERVIFEDGPVMGFSYLILRLLIVVYLGMRALRALREHAATLPVLLFTGCYNDLLLGQFGQPTELGFATIAGGLCLAASLRAGEPLEAAGETEDEEASAETAAAAGKFGGKVRAGAMAESGTVVKPGAKEGKPSVRPARGRSAYAESLHENREGQPKLHEQE